MRKIIVLLTAVLISTVFGQQVQENQNVTDRYKEIRRRIENKKQKTEEQRRKYQEWQKSLKKKYSHFPKLHAMLIHLLEYWEKGEIDKLNEFVARWRFVMSSDTIRVTLQPKGKFKKIDLDEIEKLGCRILPEESLIGIVVELPIDKLRDLMELKNLKFIRPVVKKEADYCKKLIESLQEEVEIDINLDGLPEKKKRWQREELPGSPGWERLKGQISIKFDPSVNNDEKIVEEIVTNYRCCVAEVYRYGNEPISGYYILFPVDQISMDEMLQILAHDPLVIEVRDVPLGKIHATVFPNDPLFSYEWGLHNYGQTIEGQEGYFDADIDAPEAWYYVQGRSDIVIAILDTGIDLNHEDLKNKLWINTKEIPNNGIDDDFNGFIDDYYGWDFVNNDNDPSDDHILSHGTHVAGIAAAETNNNKGIAGVNWYVKLMPLKILDDNGGGSFEDLEKGIRYAVNNGAKIINLSLASTDTDIGVEYQIREAYNKGVVIVAAAGNEDRSVCFPARLSQVIAVGATDNKDHRWYEREGVGSNYGEELDLTAPGKDIYSTIRNNSYGYKTGTSMSAPFVSGAVALVLSKYPELTPEKVREHLMLTADVLGPPGSPYYGAGRLNIYKAVYDTLPPKAPIVTSPTHPKEDVSYANKNPQFNWAVSWDVSGIEGYSYVLDQVGTTVPDETIDTTETTVSFTNVPIGVWYFHIRAKDKAGNWGETAHYKI